jgi:uncharacterized cupredoxin-like copper-binding protein/sugar lactone lactonase YvrE
VSLAAHRLTNPRGFTWDANGDLYVALAGSGGAAVLGPDAGGGYATTGSSGIVVRIDHGEPVTVSDDLPSTTVSGERTLGPAAVAFLGDDLYVLEDANAMAFRRNGAQPDGVYRVARDGSLALVADTAAWISANPTVYKPADYNAEGELFGMLAVGNARWVVESNNGQVLQVSLDGAITRIADLSTNHPLATAPAPAPDGGIYVGFLTPAPYTDGTSKVVEVSPDGAVTDVWTGLTMVTAVAVGSDGTLYAAEMATGNGESPPYVAPATGRVVRRTGPSTWEAVATRVNYPVALAAGPDGALYVAASALGSIDPDGYILRIDPAAAGPTDVRAIAATAGGRNFSALHTDYFGDVMPGTGRATETPTAALGTPPPAAAGGTTVELDAGDFFFRPNAVTIPAETPVTFRIENVSKIPHNFSIDELRVSLAIPPGQARRVTITAPAGRYAFYCNLPGHRAAGMVGTLTVR